jgi:peptidoglycan/LPS O-acetylase OafA/YrhL
VRAEIRQPQTLKAQRSRIAGLDGLRAISIGLVLVSHSRGLGAPPDSWVAKGSFGVEVFFVLSGYLITWLLLIEESRNGRFNLDHFYIRRTLRILPPALFYLSCLSVLGFSELIALKPWDVVPCVFFFRNLTEGSNVTGHFWSLSIEEQFYLLWPVALLLLRESRARLIFVAVLVVAAPFWRQANYAMAGGAMHLNSRRFDLRYDALLIGCGLALLRFSALAQMRIRLLQSRFVPLASVAVIALMLTVGDELRVLRAFSPTIAYLAVAVTINYVIEHPERPSGQVLNQRWIVWIGMLSYSLYIWQQLAFTLSARFPIAVSARFPIAVCLALLFAVVSYYQVEAPFNALRRRWT